MARSFINAEVVDLTGDSDNSAASPKSSSNPATGSTRRPRAPLNMGIRQSIIDLTEGDDADSPITLSDQRSEASEPSPKDSTTTFPAITKKHRPSSPPHQGTSAQSQDASNTVSYPIRQSLKNPTTSLTSILSNTSPHSTGVKKSHNLSHRSIESGHVSTSSSDETILSRPRKNRPLLKGRLPSETHTSRANPNPSSRPDGESRPSRNTATITLDLPPGLIGTNKAIKSAPSDTTSARIQVKRPVFRPASRAAAQPIPQPAPTISAPSPPKTIIPPIPVVPTASASPGSSEGSIDYTPIRTHDVVLATAMLETALRNHLRTVHESHAYLVKASLRRNRLCFEREARETQRKAKAGGLGNADEQPWFMQTVSPFKKMEPVHFVVSRNEGTESSPYFAQTMFTNTHSKTGFKTGSKSKVGAHLNRFQSTAISIPAFREYVPLKDNILAENQDKLFNWPYFPDEKDRADMTRELHANYRIKNEIPSWDDKLIDVHRFYGASIDAFLKQIGIDWQDIIYFLLASDQDIKRIVDQQEPDEQSKPDKEEYNKRFANRQSHWEAAFVPDSAKWVNLRASLSIPTPHKLRLAALACEAFLKQSGFKLWHLARRSAFMNARIQSLLEGNDTQETKFEYRKYACRICQMHHCSYHGAFEEVPGTFDDAVVVRNSHSPSPNELARGRSVSLGTGPTDDLDHSHNSSSDSGSDSDSSVFDSDIEVVTNHRRYVNAQTGATYTAPAGRYRGFNTRPPPGDFKASWWKTKTVTANWEKRTPFFPCKHEGPCDQAQCRCYRHGITCEKICSCSDSCERRFPGCSCAQTANGKQNPCRTAKCLCLTMGRECDADLCGSCGATEVLDPINRYNEKLSKACGNVAIQRGVPAKTFLGHSEVHGFGLYVGEDIQKDDFIGEYVGEVVSVREGERRGIIYTQQQTMYLFKLNSEQDIDSTHFSNKSRFINNADPEYTNCYPKDKLCNGVHRLGIYASTNIKAGTELYFHYGYSEEEMKNFKQPSRKKNLVKNNISNDLAKPPLGQSGSSQVALKSALSTRVSVRRNRLHGEIDETDDEDDEWEPSSATNPPSPRRDRRMERSPVLGELHSDEEEITANGGEGDDEAIANRSRRQRGLSMAPGGRLTSSQQQAQQQAKAKAKAKAKGKEPAAAPGSTPRMRRTRPGRQKETRAGPAKKRKRPAEDDGHDEDDEE